MAEKRYIQIASDEISELSRYKLSLCYDLGWNNNPSDCFGIIVIEEKDEHYVLSGFGEVIGVEHDSELAEKRAYDTLKNRAEKWIEEGCILQDLTKYSKTSLEAEVERDEDGTI